MTFQTDDAVSTIRAWLESTRSVGVPVGPSRREALRRGAELIARLRTEPVAELVQELSCVPEAPDALCAMTSLLDHSLEGHSEGDLRDIELAYDLVAQLSWEDEFGERDWLLARLSFHAWNQSRLLENYPALRSWQRRCHDHTVKQEPIRDFLSLPFRQRSSDLNQRFLSDESVLLAALEKLERLRNRALVELTNEGAALYEWIDTKAGPSGLEAELLQYFSATVALLVATAEGGLEHNDSLQRWLARVEQHLVRCRGVAPLEATLDHIRLGYHYWGGNYSGVLASIDTIISRFEVLRMTEAALKSRYLKALALKEGREDDKAFSEFERVCLEAHAIGDGTMASLATSNCAQIRGAQSRFAEASEMARKAHELAKSSGTAFALALATGTAGELFRDQGDLESALRAYAGSARYYTEAGMESLEAYTRLLIAETLLMAGRAREATCAVLMALPAIENHQLGQEAVAAVSLLRQAVHLQQSNPELLHHVREQLRMLREQGRL